MCLILSKRNHLLAHECILFATEFLGHGLAVFFTAESIQNFSARKKSINEWLSIRQRT